MDFKKFKRAIAEGLVLPHKTARIKDKAEKAAKRKRKDPPVNANPAATIGSLNDGHFLIEAYTTGANCYVCYQLGKHNKEVCEYKIRTGCPECKKCFHPNCYTAFHHEGAGNLELADQIGRLKRGIGPDGKPIKQSGKGVTRFPSLAELELNGTPLIVSFNRRTKAQIAADRAAAAAAVAQDRDLDDDEEMEPQNRRRRLE
jgi:hypothetical protein